LIKMSYLLNNLMLWFINLVKSSKNYLIKTMIKQLLLLFVILSILPCQNFSYAKKNDLIQNQKHLKKIETTTLLLPWKHQFQFAGFYMAKEKGFYKQARIQVDIKEYQLNQDNTALVMTNENYFGVGHSSLILDKLNRYPKILLLAAIHQSAPLVLLAKKRTDLQTVADLVNKKVMITNDQTSNASINAMLVAEKLPQNSFQIVETTFNPIDLINGHADLMTAYISNELFTLEEKGIEYRIFDPKDYDFDFYSDLLFTSSELLKSKPELVYAFYWASIKGWLYAYANIQQTVDVIYNQYNTQNKTKKALLFEAQKLKELAFIDGVKFGHIHKKRLREIANAYRLLGLVKDTKIKYGNFEDFIYPKNKEGLSEDELLILSTINEPLVSKLSVFDKWLSLDYIQSNHPHLIWLILSFMLAIIIINFYFTQKFNKQIKFKTKEINQQLKLFDRYISASHTDINGFINYASEEFCRISGYSEKELIGQPHSIIKDSETPIDIYQDLWMTIKSGHIWKGEIKNRTKQGNAYWINAIISPIIHKDKSNKAHIVGFEALHQNITDKKILQRFNKEMEEQVRKRTCELHNSQKYLDTLFDVNPSIAYVFNGKQIERVNKAFLEFTDFSSLADFSSKYRCISELFEKRQGYLNPVTNLLKNISFPHNKMKESYKALMIKDNQEYIFSINSQLFIVDNEERYLVILENITKLENLAIHDKLTQLYNRIYIDQVIDYQIKQLIRYHINFSLIIIDVDRFKNINDIYGHQQGDKILKLFATILKDSIRDVDIVGRWGGEEFMIICPQSNIEGTLELAEKIRQQIESFNFQIPEKITASFGVAQSSMDMHEQQLIKNADNALYQAKKQGRNQVVQG